MEFLGPEFSFLEMPSRRWCIQTQEDDTPLCRTPECTHSVSSHMLCGATETMLVRPAPTLPVEVSRSPVIWGRAELTPRAAGAWQRHADKCLDSLRG